MRTSSFYLICFPEAFNGKWNFKSAGNSDHVHNLFHFLLLQYSHTTFFQFINNGCIPFGSYNNNTGILVQNACIDI